MLTIFAIPKSFEGDIAISQENAIKSWLLLLPKPQIILFGDEIGIKEISDKFGIQHVKDVRKNEFGTPLLNWVFDKAKDLAENNILAYVNSDIILTQDFIDAVSRIKESKFVSFLASGQREDLDLNKLVDFSKEGCIDNLKKKGIKHGMSGMDYFIFPRNFSVNLPDFAVGISGWDSWLVYQTKRLKIPFIDATLLITAIHQNHLPRHQKQLSYEQEKTENFKLAGGQINMMSLREADWILTKDGIKRPGFPRIIFC